MPIKKPTEKLYALQLAYKYLVHDQKWNAKYENKLYLNISTCGIHKNLILEPVIELYASKVDSAVCILTKLQ